MADEKPETTESSGTNQKEQMHHAYTVTNIHTKVRTLDGKKVTYSQWVKLMKLHLRAFKLYDHIDGTPPPTEDDPAYSQWSNLDALILQWMYATVNDDIFARVLADDTTARDIWLKLEQVFLNNKNARASALENEFTKQTLTGCGGL